MGLVKTKLMIGSQVYHYDQIDAFDSALSLLSQTRQDLSGLFGQPQSTQSALIIS